MTITRKFSLGSAITSGAFLLISSFSQAQNLKISKGKHISEDGSKISNAESQKPNVIMFVTDDLGWGDISAYGHPDIHTPNIDRLAAEGQMFTQFYVSSPVCSPSRASILSGRYSGEVGINYAIGAKAGDELNEEPWLSSELPNIYKVFKEAGYRTGHFGKWHLGGATERGKAPPPRAYGIDKAGTTNSTGAPLIVKDSVVFEETLGDSKSVINKKKTARSGSTSVIVDAGINFIGKQGGRPFLLSLWTLEPHAVLDPTPEQMEPFLKFTHPKVVDHLKGSQTIYYASLANIDTQVGRLLDYLDENNLRDNTIVVFTSDNGPSPLWSKGTSHAGAGLAGPLRGVKGSNYEGGIRVPFIVRWPGAVPANTLNTETILGAVDLLPTLSDLSDVGGVDKIENLDGENLSRAITGEKIKRSSPLFWDYRGGSWGRDIQRSPQLAMRDGDWKLLMNPDGTRTELYNLSQDESETSNVALYEKARVKEMSARLMQWYKNEVPGHDRVPTAAGKKKWRLPVNN